MKWIEVNIGVPSDVVNCKSILKDFVSPFVEENMDTYSCWHYLWERKPWPEIEGEGVTLLLRFYGEDEMMDGLKDELEQKLTQLHCERPENCLGHCFGAHGECGDEYVGEANTWGEIPWEYGMKFFQIGSEYALDLLRNEEKLGRSDEYKEDAYYYADRYVHCFLNQMAMLVNEVGFLHQQYLSRRSQR